jgi:hypothetical protein
MSDNDAYIHGHGAEACHYCHSPENCDCPCTTCIHARHFYAGSAVCKCGCEDATVADDETENDTNHDDEEEEEEEEDDGDNDERYDPDGFCA